MAGYIFTIDGKNPKEKISLLEKIISKGVYSTRGLSPSGGKWKNHIVSTFGDYACMRPGDHVYFFLNRRIFGIGKLVDICDQGPALSNFPGASEPSSPPYKAVKSSLIIDLGNKSSLSHRWLCTFIPSPKFFKSGVDMDEALQSAPGAFRVLRAMEKRSFVRLDDEEDEALARAVLRGTIGKFEEAYTADCVAEEHLRISSLLSAGDYRLTPESVVKPFVIKNNSVSCKMAVEASLAAQLTKEQSTATTVFGHWDFVTHQAPASPAKPVLWIDRMDIFGYRYMRMTAPIDIKPPIEKYLVVELKKTGQRPTI